MKKRLLVFFVIFWALSHQAIYSATNDVTNLQEEQIAEKDELEQMREQLKELKATTNDAMVVYHKLDSSPLKKGLQEFHLFCRAANHEILPGKTVECLTYNGILPGPLMKVKEGQLVRIVIHNQLDQSTSFHLHGMILPESVDGLPNSQNDLIKPGQTYAYQFVAKPAGLYWYHPQIMHTEQRARGMYGALIVEPEEASVKAVDNEQVLVLGDTSANKWQSSPNLTSKSGVPKAAYLINGKTAPAIPVLEVRLNSRVRLNVINAGQYPIPLHVTGHKFEIISLNGNLVHNTSDTITCGVGDRLQLEFTADNPGVWSLGSELLEQCTENGRFPSGIACLIRYME